MKRLTLILFAGLFSLIISGSITLQDVLDNTASSIPRQQEAIDRSVNNKALLSSLVGYMPRLSYYVSIDSTTNTDYSYSQGFSLNQTLVNIPYLMNIVSGKYTTDIANLSYTVNSQNLIYDAIDKFFSLLEYQIRLELDSMLVEKEEKNILKAKSRFKKGILSGKDFRNLEANYYNIRSRLYSNQMKYNNLVSEFEVLTGIEVKEDLMEPDSVPYMESSRIKPDEILPVLPEYILHQKNYAVKSVSQANALTEFFPTANLSLRAGISDSVYSFNMTDFRDNYSLSASVNINFPLFTGFSRTLNVIQKSGEKKKAGLEYKKAELTYRAMLENFPSMIKQIEAMYLSAENAYNSQKISFEIASQLFENNELSSIDYIDAQREYINSRINLIQIKNTYYQTYHRYLYYLRRIK
ncbi:MAG: TolC family protein [bacterium]